MTLARFQLLRRSESGRGHTIMLRVPAHTRIAAHSHRDDRVATVIFGTWRIGYPHVSDLSWLLKLNKELYLLAEPAARTGGPEDLVTTLSHDILAPIIRREFVLSLSSAARARRLIENRAREWAGGNSGDRLHSVELSAVEKGLFANAKSQQRREEIDPAKS